MTITLTANYRETLNVETVSMIDNLICENYDLAAMLEFIDEHNEEDFVKFYEEYVRCGEIIGYDAVDALIEESDMESITDCDERFVGCYESTADFAEQFVSDMGYQIPDIVCVDWEQTWCSFLYYDHTACEVGYREVYIFRDNW